MAKNIWAIIPARTRCKSIKEKNIIPLNKKPLIFYTIRSALKSKIFSSVLVLTDSLKFAKQKPLNPDESSSLYLY